MDKMDLKKYGITGVTEIVYNPSYDELFREETKKGLRGFEKGQLTETGAVNVMTGVYTGRSPKDKFFVMDETTKDTIWWTSDEYKNDNKPVTKAAWKELKKLATQELSGKKLYVVDTFCGANENSRLKIRFIMEVAWQAHFVKNMFIRPTDAELEKYGEPDFVVLNASKAKVKNYKKLGLNSETAVVFNLTEKMQVILNTWYGGEMKKGMFSYMNYLLPLKGMASMHCSANTNAKGETAIFFGLSGTGKTTLSTDPKRQLIGDDEHGWDDDGVFNFEGGCYAKVINLSQENEPDIWNAIRRNALLENVTVDKKGKIDYADKSVTENTRVSYPIFHIENIVKPVSKAPAAKKVIFLSADAFGVLPPVSILNAEQTKYYFLSGFTAKLAGTGTAGQVFVDGYGVGDVGSVVLRDRRHLAQDGMIVVVLSMSGEDGALVSGPDIITRGFVYVKESEGLMEELRQVAMEAIQSVDTRYATDWSAIKSTIKGDLSNYLYKKTKRSPMILPVIMEV